MGGQIPCVPLRKLDYSKHASQNDNHRRAQEQQQERVPGVFPIVERVPHCRVPHTLPEDDGNDQEKAKEGKLDKETDQHDLLPHICLASLRHQPTSSSFHKKGNHLADDEDFGHAGWTDERGIGRIDEESNAPKDDVDSGGVQRGGKNGKQRLYNVRAEIGG